MTEITQAPYTHRQWRAEMNAMLDFLRTDVAAVMERMHASVTAMRGGATQLAQLSSCRMAVADLISDGAALVASADARQVPIADAQAAAGGVTEVAGDKRYHTAG